MQLAFFDSISGRVVIVRHPFRWCLLFGGLYFWRHQAWRAGLAALLSAICTLGIAWLVCPFFAARIVRRNYVRKGWLEIPLA